MKGTARAKMSAPGTKQKLGADDHGVEGGSRAHGWLAYKFEGAENRRDVIVRIERRTTPNEMT